MRQHISKTSRVSRLAPMLSALLIAASACDRSPTPPPPLQSSLDGEFREAMSHWGALPIGPVPTQNAALVDLGQSLFFDKILSGNRDVSCGTCHDPLAQMGDGLSLAIGTGANVSGSSRTVGAGRGFVPRNAPSLINQGLGFFYMLWDGRVNEEGPQGKFNSPPGIVLPSGLNNLLAAQAMLPVLNRAEMRGLAGDVDRFGNTNELAPVPDSSPAQVWKNAMTRVLAVQEYVNKFSAAYPGVPASSLGFQHAANALAAFQIARFTRTNSPFDRFLSHDDRAMTDDQKRGGILFFGKAMCVTCHSGALLGGRNFANIGVPQVGPGVGNAAPLDIGRAENVPANQQQFYKFNFRVPPLRNVELTAPYMHNGAYRTLDAVVRHYTNADSAQRNYDVTQLDAAVRGQHHGDAATLSAVSQTLDFRIKEKMIKLNPTEQAQVVAFLKSLTDPAARNLGAVIPPSVPSGLPVRD